MAGVKPKCWGRRRRSCPGDKGGVIEHGFSAESGAGRQGGAQPPSSPTNGGGGGGRSSCGVHRLQQATGTCGTSVSEDHHNY